MTPRDLQQSRARAAMAASRLRLPFRTRTWRGQAGEFSGGGVGSSLDFQDHRAYMPGDDPRHINWQAYARTGNYTMKLFREEVRPVVDVIFDASESMFFDPVKSARTLELLWFLIDGSAAAGASVHAHALRGNVLQPMEPATIGAGQWLSDLRETPAGDASSAPDVTAAPLRSGSIRVLLSDLLFAGDPEPVLRHLAQRHGTVILFAPFLREEAAPDWEGNIEFIDVERRTRHPHRIDTPVLARYREAYANHFSLWKHSSTRHQAVLARVSCEDDLVTTLFREALPVKALETIHG